MGTHKPGEPLRETGEYFNAKERRRSSIDDDDDDDAGRNQNDVEIQPLHPISSNFNTLEGLPPSPFHFTHLNSPHPHAHCTPSPHNFNKPRRTHRRSCCFLTRLSCCCCCCSLCSICSVLITAIGVTALLTWLILLRPVHLPQYSLDNVELRNLTVTTAPNGPDGPDGSDYSSVNADVVVTITVENLNRRLGFKYDGVGIETLYRGQVFGRSSVGSFALGNMNATVLTAEVVVKDYVFVPASLGRDLSRDYAKLARVELRVRASAKVRVKMGVFTSFAVKVFLNCDVVVKPPRGNSPSRVIDKACKLTR